MLVLCLFASVRLFTVLGGSKEASLVAGMPVSFLLAAGLFVVLAALVGILTFGLQTGLRGLDAKSRAFVDLLADTQTELQKVSWPTREELRSSTIVVLVCILVLGAFLYAVDVIVSFLMTRVGVLPG